MKKFVVGAFLTMGVLVSTTTSASAASWFYTGHYYGSQGACEQAWLDMHGGGGAAGPHQCRHVNNSWQLWEYR